MTTGARKNGEFCWINMLTPDLAGSQDFYAKVFGWTYAELPGMGGAIAMVDGQEIGGVWDLNSPNTPKGTPPCIGVMIRTDSCDALAAKVQSLGGTSKPPFDIMTNGRMGECFDPNGAQFDTWQPIEKPGMTADPMSHGVPSYFETMTTDVAKATAFYTGSFGWTASVKDMGGMEYTTFLLGDQPVAGMMPIAPQMGPIPPHWGVYFTVKDADAAAATAKSLGATLFIPPMDIPGVGRFAGVISPQGVRFYIINYRM